MIKIVILQNAHMMEDTVATLIVAMNAFFGNKVTVSVMKSAIPLNATLIMEIEDSATMGPVVIRTKFLMISVILNVYHYTVVLITVNVKWTDETYTNHVTWI